jgi:hypothetical protein
MCISASRIRFGKTDPGVASPPAPGSLLDYDRN